MARSAPSFSQAGEIIAAVLLAVAIAGLQVFIGGTRLAYALPVYALLGFAGLLAVLSLRTWRPAPDRLCLCSAALFFGYILIRAWFSPVSALSRPEIFSVLGGLIVYLGIVSVITDARWRLAILIFLVLVALIQVGIGAIQFRDGNNFMPISFLQRFDYGRRASGFFVCPNHFAGTLEILATFCFTIAFWSRWRVWGKLLIGYAGAICLVGLALTGSRGGYLSTSASLLIAILLSLLALRKAGNATLRRTLISGAFLAILVVTIAVVTLRKSDFLSGRARTVFDVENVRLDLWRAAVAQWQLQPVFGTGSGTYLYYGRRFRTQRVQLDPVEVHNDYLQLLAEYGLVGGIAFLCFFGTHLRAGGSVFLKLGPRRMAVSFRVPSNNLALNIGALSAVAAYVVHSALDFNLHIPANVSLMAFVLGILANPGFERESDRDRIRQPSLCERLPLPLLGLILLAGVARFWRAELYAERARAALRDERQVEAIRWAQQAIAQDDQNPETFFYLGESRVRRAEEMGNPAAAASFYRAAIEPFARALALAPDDETLMVALGRVYDSLGRFTEAEWMFAQARVWDPRSDAIQKSYAAHLARWEGRPPGDESPAPQILPPDRGAPLPLPTPSASPR